MDSDSGAGQLPGGSNTSRTGTTPLESETPVLGETGYTPEDINPHDPDPLFDTSASDLEARQHEQRQPLRTEPLAPESSTVDDGQREPIQPDPLVQEPTDDGPGEVIHLPKLETTQRFLDALRNSSIEDSGMLPDDIESLRNPSPVLDLADPSPLLRSLRHFINNAGSSRAHYDNVREIELLHNPSDAILSFDQVKRRLRHLSGVVPLEHDMCPGSCIAYTGPYNELSVCPRCSTTRYFPDTDKPRKRFTTIPIGPVIQAFYGSRDVADHMHYLERRLAANADQLRQPGSGGNLDIYDDTACGKELIDAWTKGTFLKSDIALQLSIDGAQLRPDQPSEAWVFIWIFHNLPPQLRYKKRFVIPASIVPGPNKPEDIDSFLFPSLSHVAALQREGLRIYDAFLEEYVARSVPAVIFATADSPGSAAMSGMVGHSGKFGCRLYCNMPSRRRKGDGHYYPVMQRPHNYNITGCSHPDVPSRDLVRYRSDLAQKYHKNLEALLAAKTQRNYEIRRRELGLCKQTLLNGLPHRPLPVPNIFTMDIMHLTVLNDPDLFTKLFLGKLDVYGPDEKSTWDWAVFYHNSALWNAHGETVDRAVPFLPSSFGRAPRNPAKKLNTGYKAWEFQQYLYGLGPTLFRHILPHKYWLNFCKLVAGVRILQRHSISFGDLCRGHELLMEFVREFEDLYYQRMEARIHFVRHSIHLLTHMGPETFRIGPLSCYAQWTLETAIGNLSREIRQDRDQFANLAQRAVIRAQVNSLCAQYPRIKFEVGSSAGTSNSSRISEFEGGFIFLPRCEEFPLPLDIDELVALKTYWQEQGWPNADSWPNAVCRWAKLRLPNGQIARSTWYESNVKMKLRRASCVEVSSLLSYGFSCMICTIDQEKWHSGEHARWERAFLFLHPLWRRSAPPCHAIAVFPTRPGGLRRLK